MKRHRPEFWVAALLAAAGTAAPLCADVFWRIPKRADSVLQQLGGTCVYTTDARLNGAAGTLAAYAFDDGAAQVRSRLAQALGLHAEGAFGGTFMSHVEKDRLQRLLILPASGSAAACVVLRFDQATGDAARAARTPPPWPSGLPTVTGTPLFSAVCTATGTSFGVAETEADPQAAVQEAAQALSQAGWTELSPHSAAAAPSARIFTSGKKISVLFASRRTPADRTQISVLQREGASP